MNCINVHNIEYCQVPATPETILDHLLLVMLEYSWIIGTWLVPIVVGLCLIQILYSFFMCVEE